jgi:hypothetical protein
MSHPADDASAVSGDAHGALRPLPTAESDTGRLAERARRDLAALAHPAAAWVRPALHASGQHVFDVVIVGAGRSGLIIGLALKRKGVCNVLLLDRNPTGYEGPWETFARMAVLRSPRSSEVEDRSLMRLRRGVIRATRADGPRAAYPCKILARAAEPLA